MINLLLWLLTYTAYADSSILIDSTSYLYGNVKFRHNELYITSKIAIVSPDKVTARDSVSILKGDFEILTDFGEYFWNKEIKLYNGFVAYGKYETFTGREGRYFEDKLWVTDSIKYVNTNENWVVSGQQGFYDIQTHFAMITDSPKFEAIQDSIYVVGDTIKLFKDTLTKVIHNTIVKLSGIQCFAESLIYLPKVEQVLLYGNPIIVSEVDSLKGVQMKIMLSDKKIDRILVEGKVWGRRWKI